MVGRGCGDTTKFDRGVVVVCCWGDFGPYAQTIKGDTVPCMLEREIERRLSGGIVLGVSHASQNRKHSSKPANNYYIINSGSANYYLGQYMIWSADTTISTAWRFGFRHIYFFFRRKQRDSSYTKLNFVKPKTSINIEK